MLRNACYRLSVDMHEACNPPREYRELEPIPQVISAFVCGNHKCEHGIADAPRLNKGKASGEFPGSGEEIGATVSRLESLKYSISHRK